MNINVKKNLVCISYQGNIKTHAFLYYPALQFKKILLSILGWFCMEKKNAEHFKQIFWKSIKHGFEIKVNHLKHIYLMCFMPCVHKIHMFNVKHAYMCLNFYWHKINIYLFYVWNFSKIYSFFFSKRLFKNFWIFLEILNRITPYINHIFMFILYNVRFSILYISHFSP